MPVGIKTGRIYDWPVLHAEFISGVPLKKIAEKYQIPLNTLRVTASRKGWTHDKTRNHEIRTDVVCKAVNRSLAEDAKRFTRIVVDGLLTASKDLFSRPIPQNPYEANAHAGALQKVNDMGRKALGLEGENTLKIQVGLVGSMPEIANAIEVQASVTEHPAIESSTTSSTSVGEAPETPANDQLLASDAQDLQS